MLKDKKLIQLNNRGFTIVELLVIAPIVLLTIGAFITAIVNMTGDVLASRTSNVLTYDIQDTLNRIDDDVKLSSSFLAQSNTTLTAPQGYNNDTTQFKNSSVTNGDMLILNTLATTDNPISTSAGMIYLNGLPNDCASAQVNQNRPMTLNIIYFVKNQTLWRRTAVPPDYTTAGCAIPWQQPSCNPDYMTTNPSLSVFCKTRDIKLIDGVNIGDFVVNYYTNAGDTIVNTVASDPNATDNNRGTALASSTTVSVGINITKTAAGRTVSGNGTIRSTKLDINASSVTVPVTPTAPRTPSVTASLSGANQVVFTWPIVQNATGYTFQYQLNGTGGAWTTAFTNQNTTTYTVTANHTDVVYGHASSTNSLGTSSYSSNASMTIPLWATPSLQSGWANYGGARPDAGYTKTSSGMIMLKGLIKGGNATSSTVIFTLPVGYRPAYNMIFQNSTNNAAGRVDVWADGTVRFQIGSNVWFGLDNINFLPAGVGTFTNLAVSGGWVNNVDIYANPLAYIVDSAGRTRLKGMINGGTTTSGTVIATLPVGLNPSLYTHIATDAGNANAHYSIDHANRGIVAKGYSNAWLSVNGLFYPSTYPTTGSCDVAWCALSFQNGWSNYTTPPYASGSYTKGTDGVVQLKGLVKGGTMGVTIAQLPVGYRPKSQLLIGTESNALWGAIDIDASGNIIASSGSNVWYSLDGLSFFAEQ